MTQTCATVKVKSSHPKTQGAFVEINESDFNPNVHELYDAEQRPMPTRAELNAALKDLPGTFTDPDFVVDGMKKHWGDVFTEADEKQVRDVVRSKPSDGLTVPQIKDALTAKNIAIPDGVTLKADLAALLDGAPAT